MATMTPTIRRYADFTMAPEAKDMSYTPQFPAKFSPDSIMTQMWMDTNTVQSYGEFLPKMPKTPHFVTSPSTFKPLNVPSLRGEATINIPRTTPFEYRKPSPTPSHTSATTDSYDDSISTLDSSNASRHFFMPVWIGPRDATIVRVLEKSFDRARSPLLDIAAKNKRRDEDPVRKSRLKTELCMHYENGTHCPFGANCTYAHGEEELQMTKLMDLHRAGLVELDTYRTKPCLTWISTGSCPFGKRCNGIHDPRAAGTQQSWLPHTETQGNTIATDINVEALHQKRLHVIHYNNPFGDLFHMDVDNWEDLYKLICNVSTGTSRRRRIAEHHKVDIALQMRGSSEWHYKFRPQHIIYDELCMVLQKRAFRLTERGAIEIPLNVYHSKRFSNQVVVREIAFGPDCDSSVRGVSLWFDIDDRDVTVCTPQQAKRYRWKKGATTSPRSSPFAPYKLKPSKFDSKDCFVMVRPTDKDAYDLSTNILAHHLGVLRAKHLSNLKDRFEALKKKEEEVVNLKHVFENLQSCWKKWAWPITNGRATVDETTPVPPVDGLYNPTSEDEENRPKVQRIWDSFVTSPFQKKKHARLSVFEQLEKGESVLSTGGRIPHISKRVAKKPKISSSSDSERCWKALLLPQASTPFSHYEAKNEWLAVLDHFSNSRSKKVLSILQQ